MAARVTAISGLGTGSLSTNRVAIGWGLIMVTAAVVFAGTLMLRPGKGS